jgi:4a-hydroxytetrahydrobiopterin dehydratase
VTEPRDAMATDPPQAVALSAAHAQAGAPRLDAAVVAAALALLPGWTQRGDALERTFRFDDFQRTMAFVNAVAFIAQREDHHPELAVHFDRCVVRFTTHDAGGVTRNDLVLAARVGALLS